MQAANEEEAIFTFIFHQEAAMPAPWRGEPAGNFPDLSLCLPAGQVDLKAAVRSGFRGSRRRFATRNDNSKARNHTEGRVFPAEDPAGLRQLGLRAAGP